VPISGCALGVRLEVSTADGAGAARPADGDSPVAEAAPVEPMRTLQPDPSMSHVFGGQADGAQAAVDRREAAAPDTGAPPA
jgi:hypothetical protein